MLEVLSEKFSNLWEKLGKEKKLTTSNIEQGIREIRMALLEAEVHIEVVRSLINKLKDEAVGERIIKDVDPTKMFIKIVNDLLVELLGGEKTPIALRPREQVSTILISGLQGSGKTTTIPKLGVALKDRYDVLTVSLDLNRPAAAEQLKIISEQAGLAYFERGSEKNIADIIRAAKRYADEKVKNLILFDTAGRTQTSEEMLAELKEIYAEVKPDESILVCDTMLGQQSLKIAEEFRKTIPVQSLIFTKFDSDARGGAILSVKHVLDLPIRYVGVGEKTDDFEEFDPQRVVNRILGMGDIVGLVKKAEKAMEAGGFSETDPEKLMDKIKNNQFDLGDFLSQLQGMKKMGSLQSIMGMIPGMAGQLKNVNLEDKQFKKMEAIIQSMTKKERQKPVVLDNSRKKRIANGSGSTIVDVNQLLKKFFEAKDTMRKMSNPKKTKKMLNKLGLNPELLGKNL